MPPLQAYHYIVKEFRVFYVIYRDLSVPFDCSLHTVEMILFIGDIVVKASVSGSMDSFGVILEDTVCGLSSSCAYMFCTSEFTLCIKSLGMTFQKHSDLETHLL